tara:strand:+ start:3424 stop:3957 length:534 start_codon:yes stop_codon:yes gene_type:complete
MFLILEKNTKVLGREVDLVVGSSRIKSDNSLNYFEVLEAPDYECIIEKGELVNISEEADMVNKQSTEYVDNLINESYSTELRNSDTEAYSTLTLYLGKAESSIFSSIDSVLTDMILKYFTKSISIELLIKDKVNKIEFKKLLVIAIKKYWIKMIRDERIISTNAGKMPTYVSFPEVD